MDKIPEIEMPDTVETEEVDSTVLIGVHPSDMAIIISGLKEMPQAITQVANAVEVLAESNRRAPTKLGSAIAAMAAAVFVVVAVGWQTLQLGNSLEDAKTLAKETQVVAEDAKEIAEETFDCLDYDTTGAPVGKCAQRTVGVISAFAAELTQDVRCQSEIQFFLFLANNPNLGVVPPPLSERCERQFAESMAE